MGKQTSGNMLKTIILIILIIVIVLILTLGGWNASKCAKEHVVTAQRKKSKPFSGTSKDKVSADLNMILSDDESMLTYSMVLKGADRPVIAAILVNGQKEVHRIKGINGSTDDEIILHGLWRRQDTLSLGPNEVQALKDGKLEALLRFDTGGVGKFGINLK